MDSKTGLKTDLIDKMIFFFMIVFILSLSNSIFINQIGYYACLILLIIKYIITKNNPFNKTGLELAFAWFIAAEIISAVLSEYQSAAFINVFKRSLLLGIVYVTLASSYYVSRTKIYFKFYIVGSIITCLIYLYHSYSYFTNNLFGQFESGPSVFQYPITSSEIMSFTVVFLFAFLMNEKTTWRNKLIIIAGLLISSAALLATYKRTGWLGTAFGFLIILLIKRQWKILIPAGAALLVFFMLQSDSSSINIFNLNGTAHKEKVILTNGRASDIIAESEFSIVADYNNGVLLYKDTVLVDKMETPAPSVSLIKWNEGIYAAHLLDTRFILFRQADNQLISLSEFISPGLTASFVSENGSFYIMDTDSGLTVFMDPYDLNNFKRMPEIRGHSMSASDSRLIIYSANEGLTAYDIEQGLPRRETESFVPDKIINSLFYHNGLIYTSDSQGINTYRANLHDDIIPVDSSSEAPSIFKWEYVNGRLFAADKKGNLFELEFPSERINILNKWKIDNNVKSLSISGSRVYSTYFERNRLLSFVDPNHPTNYTRLGLWKTGIRIFKDFPIFGVGDIGLGDYHKKYKEYYEKEIHGHLHNNFMHILATLGLFGLLAIIYMFVKIIMIDLRIYNELKNVPFASSYSLGALGTFFAFLFSGLTELNFGDHEIITLVWFIFGLNLAFYKNHLSVHKTDFRNGN